MGYRECFSKQGYSKSKKWARRQMHKYMRRAGKRLLDDAPTRYRYFGWWT